MYKMKVLGLRKFNEQDQKEYIGVEDVANSYITNHENGDIIISKTTDGYLVSKFPIDTENEEGEEKTVTTLSEAIDVALQYQDDLDNAKAPEQIMYKETEEDEEDSEKGFDDEINPFERAAWEAEQYEIRKAYEALGLDYDEFEKAKHQDGDMHPNGKWVWRQSANGGKGDWRVASPSKRGGGAKKTAAASTTSTTQKQEDKQPAASKTSVTEKKVGIAEVSHMLIETARKNKKYVNLSVDVNGKSNTVTATDTWVMVRNDKGKVVKSTSPAYSNIMQAVYNKTKKKTDITSSDNVNKLTLNGVNITVKRDPKDKYGYIVEGNGKSVKTQDPSFYNVTKLTGLTKKTIADMLNIPLKTTKKNADDKKSY